MKTLYIALLLLVSGCGGSPYPGFKEVSDGVYLSHHILGDGETTAKDGDSIEMVLRISGVGQAAGSLLSTQQWFAASDLRIGGFVPLLQRMRAGDSLTVIAPASLWPWSVIAPPTVAAPADTAMLQVEVMLVSIRTPAMVQARLQAMRDADPEGFERRLIEAYLGNSKEPWQRWGASMLHYHISGTAMDTARVRPGDMVEVVWRGTRLEDGLVIDDTRRSAQPFSFRYGDPDQVMKGVETAVMLLREGQEGAFIIPSSMAFGERGVDGLVEPRSPVVYHVELKRIER
jgi:FK506-binding protein 2